MATFETHPQQPTPETKRRWRMPWIEFIASFVIIAGALVFLYPHIASWFSQKEQSRVTTTVLEKLNEPPGNSETYRSFEIDKAHQYNEALASGAVFRANANIATGSGNSADDSLIYTELLDVTGTGLMGRLRYNALNIDLPIYHGTSDDTLNKGVGHLEGTSLPVGGIDNRSVLTAHRGLPESTLFNDLNVAKVGDTFTVTVLGEVLTYQVTETQVIEPDQTEAILPIADTDMITLVTCTPLGVNSHRILVNAQRITPTPIGDITAANAAPILPGFPWWAVGVGGVLGGAGLFVWRSGYSRKLSDSAEFSESGRREGFSS